MAKVADLYYRLGLKQTAISAQLGVHQSSISRLLKRAEQEGIVRFTLNYPVGFHPELESALEKSFGLKQAIVVDSAPSDRELVRLLGSATATHLSGILRPADVVGISSWSSSLLAIIEAMRTGDATGAKVVQILGGVGNPSAEAHATHLTQRLAQLINGAPVLLGAPGVVPNANAREVLMNEPYVRQALGLFKDITIALVGIGAVEPSTLLSESGNAFSDEQLQSLKRAGAVGDICMRFFDAHGKPVDSALNAQVIGMSLDELKNVSRVVGVAGGMRKRDAILAALRGGWIDVLVTDADVAESIVQSLGEDGK
tara:strand:+ start:9437 stop:10375 length:939 start_codon:yes stop_codon:yes gene_type:complete